MILSRFILDFTRLTEKEKRKAHDRYEFTLIQHVCCKTLSICYTIYVFCNQLINYLLTGYLIRTENTLLSLRNFGNSGASDA